MIDYQKIEFKGKCIINFESKQIDSSNLNITWTPGAGLSIKARLEEADTSCKIGTKAKLTGHLTDKELTGMEFICEKATLIRIFTMENSKESYGELYFHQFAPFKILSAKANICHYEYFLPNFIFDDEKQIGDSEDNEFKLGGFKFDYLRQAITVQQIKEYKKISKTLKNFGVSAAITSILKIPVKLIEDNPKFTDQLCLLISALYGIDIRPQVCIVYDMNKNIAGIIINNHSTKPYHRKRTFINKLRTDNGWGVFLESSLPVAIHNFESYHLGQVCNQSVESQRPMSLISQTAIIWICLENFTTNILHESGNYKKKQKSKTEQAQLDDKLNLVNKDIKVIPKSFTQKMKKEKWIKTIRNPLFHQGSGKLDQLLQIYYDLLTMTMLLLCGECGYKGKIVYPKINHPDGQEIIDLNNILK